MMLHLVIAGDYLFGISMTDVWDLSECVSLFEPQVCGFEFLQALFDDLADSAFSDAEFFSDLSAGVIVIAFQLNDFAFLFGESLEHCGEAFLELGNVNHFNDFILQGFRSAGGAVEFSHQGICVARQIITDVEHQDFNNRVGEIFQFLPALRPETVTDFRFYERNETRFAGMFRIVFRGFFEYRQIGELTKIIAAGL